ncbi:MAG: hypothetical protein H6610_02225 [Ignavibacteriales bacterium]|nr:hypothetical protein [Ignavibacteriales bacterium]MCB9218260.1 hypothetical protein [Ignavibacteriales bacterium]
MSVLFSLIIFSTTIYSSNSSLNVGASFRNITPDPLLPVSGGVGIPNPVEMKKGELTTRAIVIVSNDTKIALVSIDNLGVPKIIGDKIRSRIVDIKPENILISATHTHSAPDLYGFADENGNSGIDLSYVDFVIDQTSDAINEALNNIQPSYLKTAVDEAKGKIAYNYYAPKLYDPRCGLIQFISADNQKPIATLVNYAIHPEVIGSDRGICTPDLVGPLYNKIESEIGGIALFVNSAQGGMVTADNRLDNGKEANDWNECIRIGELLAAESIRIISNADVQKSPEINIKSKEVVLPVESELMQFILKHSKLNYGIDENKVFTTLNIIKLGDAQILTIPGEALPNIGYYLKRKMNTQHPFLFGLTNDAFGYILTKEDFNSFKTYNYITRTSLGEKTGDIIINAAMDLINKSSFSE